jgi:hypothetical protein
MSSSSWKRVGMNSLNWDKEKLKLLPLFDEDGVFYV